MRLRIDFHATKLPIIYRHRFMALIKEALFKADPEYKQLLYPEDKKHEKPKPFVFSICPPSFKYEDLLEEQFALTISNNNMTPPTVKDKVIQIKEGQKISMFISSSDYIFITNLYNGFIHMKSRHESFRFNDDIALTPLRALLLKEKQINSNEAVFKTLCPVLLEKQEVTSSDGRQKKKDICILPPMKESDVDEQFTGTFTSIHRGILKDIVGEEWGERYFKEPLEFIPVSLKKRVIKHTISAYWQSNSDKPIMKFTCFDGCFKIKGNPHVLQMLYQIGIGLRTGQGFGMVEVV